MGTKYLKWGQRHEMEMELPIGKIALDTAVLKI